MRQVFFCDLDGTLLQPDNNHKYVVSELDKKFIKTFQKEGHEFIIASGRNCNDIKSIKDYYSIETNYHISNNGACIWKGENLLKATFLDKQIAREMLEDVVNKDYYVCISDGKDLYIENGSQRFDDTEHSAKFPPIFVDDLLSEFDKLDKISSFGMIPNICGSMDSSQKMAISDAWVEKFQTKYGDHVEMVRAGTDVAFVDVNPKNVSKGSAIKWLSSYVGGEWAMHYACGDAMNDYTMIESADHGFAIKSGHLGLKEVADYEIEKVHNAAKYMKF